MMHPSGLTLERWNWPFKTPQERLQIQRWLALHDLDNPAIPF